MHFANISDTPFTLRERAALFVRLAAAADPAFDEEELLSLAHLYLQDALELETANSDGNQKAGAQYHTMAGM